MKPEEKELKYYKQIDDNLLTDEDKERMKRLQKKIADGEAIERLKEIAAFSVALAHKVLEGDIKKATKIARKVEDLAVTNCAIKIMQEMEAGRDPLSFLTDCEEKH